MKTEENDMKSYTYTVGSAHRRDFMVRLDELGLPYTEHRNMIKSTIIVKTFTAAHEEAYYEFELDVEDFTNRLDEVKRQRAERKQEACRKEQAEKLAKKNLFRKLTFRKPVQSL